MNPLPNETLVVRGGQNLVENFAHGSGVTLGDDDQLQGVSVNAAIGLSVEDLTAPNAMTGYPGILNNRIGVTTVGAIRACGGDVILTPTRSNAHHATLSGLTPEQASQLFQPTVPNPGRLKKRKDG